MDRVDLSVACGAIVHAARLFGRYLANRGPAKFDMLYCTLHSVHFSDDTRAQSCLGGRA